MGKFCRSLEGNFSDFSIRFLLSAERKGYKEVTL